MFGIATLITFITAVQYLLLAKRKENLNEKAINKAYGSLFIFLTAYLVLMIVSLLYLNGYYINHSYKGNFENPSLIYIWLRRAALVSYWASFFLYYYTYEKLLKHRWHLATSFIIVLITLSIFIPFELIDQMQLYGWTLNSFYLMHTLFKFIKLTKKELKSATSIIILGTIFVGIAIVYLFPSRSEGTFPTLLLPIFWIIGIFLCLLPALLKPEKLPQSMIYWYSYFVALFIIQIINTTYMFISRAKIEYVFIAFIFLIFFIIESLLAIRSIKKEETSKSTEKISVVGIFTKPEHITEEEVYISKEKKICLVCKGKVARNNIFLCPKCDTFYCSKCSNALSDLENACWVCKTRFDESKPVKLVEQKEEEVSLEEDLYKGSKKRKE